MSSAGNTMEWMTEVETDDSRNRFRMERDGCAEHLVLSARATRFRGIGTEAGRGHLCPCGVYECTLIKGKLTGICSTTLNAAGGIFQQVVKWEGSGA